MQASTGLGRQVRGFKFYIIILFPLPWKSAGYKLNLYLLHRNVAHYMNMHMQKKIKTQKSHDKRPSNIYQGKEITIGCLEL